MKKDLIYRAPLSLLCFALFFSSCSSDDKGKNVIPSLAGTTWEYMERETRDEIEYVGLMVLSFTEKEYTLMEFYTKNNQIVDLYETSGSYLFDGRTLAFRVEYGGGDYFYYEMTLSSDGTYFVWEASGYRMIFEKQKPLSP